MSADGSPTTTAPTGTGPAEPKRNPWMWIAIALGVILVALVAYYFISSGQKTDVPDVVGKQQVDAVKILNDAGFKLGEVTSEAGDLVPEGQVISQDPAAGEQAEEGAAVSLVISAGAAQVSVPDVVGKTGEDATAELSGLGLTVTSAEDYKEDVAAGEVYAQVPAAGTALAPGSAVVIAVSKGQAPALTSVPDVVGKTQAQAEDALTSAGLKVATTQAFSDTVTKGVVAGQLPAAGAKVSPESEVQVFVSLGKGTAMVSVPSVTGLTESKAIETLKSANLSSKVFRTFSDAAAGTVFAQSPAAGTSTGAGTQVGIAVSLGKDTGTVGVPNVVNKSPEEAQSIIAAAGLVPLQVADYSTLPSGTVSAQLPVSGSSVPPGSTLVYVVSKGPRP